MSKVYDFVITSDESCMHNYNMSFMAGFLSCVPRDCMPQKINNYIEKKFFSNVPNKEGVAHVAILALRKIESYLCHLGYNVVVCPPQEATRFRAKAYVVSSMDPFGIGPATSTMIGLAGGKEPFNKYFFERLVKKIKQCNGRIIVGGPGTWEFEIFKEKQKELDIDCVFTGAAESAPKDFWDSCIKGTVPKTFKTTEMRPDSYPIKGASFWGLVEISRGCGRGCQFCDMELMSGAKWLPIDFIMKEARLNAESPYVETITLLSEDTLRYGTKPGEWKPNGKIVELVHELAKLGKPLSFSHCCFATALASPKVTQQFSEEAGLDEKHLTGFQTGIESGSSRMMQRYMQGKMRPWSPQDWPEVVEQGMAVMVDNYIIPHATLVMGLKEETADDVVKTTELVDSLSQYPSLILPLFFVPLSILKDRPFVAGMLTPEQKDLLATCSRHTAKWAQRLPNWSGSLGFFDRFVFTFGASYSFSYLDALRQGKADSASPFWLIMKSFFNAMNSQLANRSPNLEYYKETTRKYPILKKVDPDYQRRPEETIKKI